MAAMPRSLQIAALAATLLAPAVASAQSQIGRTDSIYTWRGVLPSRVQLTIRNFNGPIDVRPTSGTTAEFRGVKRARGSGSIQDIAFEIVNGSNGDVSICATLRRSSSCDDHGYRGGDVQASTRNGRVHLAGTEGTVRVSTGNGDVDVRGAKSSVRVSTGNGRVNVVTADGPVEVHTGNGDIDVAMSALRARDDMTFSTGSGSVRVTLPSGYNGELDASTGNGELSSDFDLRIQGRVDPRHVRATIGDGGPRLRLTTGNGRLAILKGT